MDDGFCIPIEQLYEYPNNKNKDTQKIIEYHVKNCPICRAIIENKDNYTQDPVLVDKLLKNFEKKKLSLNSLPEKEFVDQDTLKNLAFKFIESYIPKEAKWFPLLYEKAKKKGSEKHLGKTIGIAGGQEMPSASVIRIFISVSGTENWKNEIISLSKESSLDKKTINNLKEFLNSC